MKKVKYSGFATNTSTGRRERVEGERNFNDAHVSTRRANDVAVNDLQLRGYKDAHIDDTRVTGS